MRRFLSQARPMLLACVERVCPKGRDGAVSMPLSALRSLLFTPANDPRKLARALESEADAVIGDLEDAVLDGEKASARDGLAQGFAAASGSVTRLVRVNGAATPYFDDDLALLPALGLDGVVLPKATPEGVAALSRLGLPILAIIETALGVRCAHEIASSPAVFALLLGAVDLASELGLEPRADGLELLHIRSRLVVDSAAAGVRAPFDGVHLAFADGEGLARQAELARSLGLRGKACIHPSQLAIVNRAFTPGAAQIDWARRVIAAAGAAAEDGRGAVALEGALIDEPVVARARRIIAESESQERS
jgi:citrate lyase subunit beta/citryl-CoA lyase